MEPVNLDLKEDKRTEITLADEALATTQDKIATTTDPAETTNPVKPTLQIGPEGTGTGRMTERNVSGPTRTTRMTGNSDFSVALPDGVSPVVTPVVTPVVKPVEDAGETKAPPITDEDKVEGVPVVPEGLDLATPEGREEATISTLEQKLEDPIGYLESKSAKQQYTDVELDELTELTEPTKYDIPLVSAGAAKTATATLAEATAAEATLAEASEDVKVKDFEVALLDPDELVKNFEEIKKVQPMVAASMKTEMDSLLEGMKEGEIPVWARPAVAKVEQALSTRGISASSVGRDSLFNAIIQSAMPIAQQDAMFKQDANKVNYQAKVQAILSDTAATNAALQFNASSINQKNQFMTGLKAQVDGQNAARKDAMAQFNAQVQTDISKVNAQLQTDVSRTNAQLATNVSIANAAQMNQMAQYNANLELQRASHNQNSSVLIEQSNIKWRRDVNTINTAGVNAVNQANAQNAFNLSNQAMTFMWNEMRDQANWDFNASESEKAHAHQLEATLLANEISTQHAEGVDTAGRAAGISYDSILDGLDKLRDWMNE